MWYKRWPFKGKWKFADVGMMKDNIDTRNSVSMIMLALTL